MPPWPNQPTSQLRGIAVFKALYLLSKSLFQICLSTVLTRYRDVGLWRPIDQLPGCNPLWKSDVATKPTCESTAGPAMVGANVYFENLKVS